MRLRLPHFVALLTTLLVFTACSGGQRLRYSSAEEAYEKGMVEFKDEDYDTAIKFFRGVFQYGRGNEFAEDAQFRIAESYEKQRRYLLAAAEYNRFAKLYTASQRVPIAEFRRANMYFKSSPMYQLDQSDSRKAIEFYQLFIERYPQHELVATAQEHIVELRGKLAHKKFEAAELYQRRKMYEAAAKTYESLFDKYPETDWADDALYGAVRSYVDYADNSVRAKQDERYQAAVDNYERLTQLFPESNKTKEAQSHYRKAREALDRLRKEEEAADSIAESDSTDNR
ncbi:outer membrane protein assembly factor BamD [Longibacter salinarum]|uniref:Outer membrane protein assembly factor BamD n=1 Tax=Longibacter salinarum TaxID=1850348 RepID=A0A2A8CYD7_9BACT|nr:outer membrane protein assembly factor BamD [Longibacter salinarum]PEN13732.1 outer membrane protein assembly factor BamD [Longibacter salinarum]